ncbi:hypothetical protein [Paraburkholderia silvatlantica]|uniref:hypothetical protein n=1 Tax=Paraburkholderia silvatlantica TaxID=321895 RepID=UPI0010600FF5|nr:hypothetical protein [Paraburkholderia silvatlantica]
MKAIPPDVAKHLAGDGYKPFPQRKFISWDDGIKHYLIMLRDKGGGCGVVDFNESKGDYSIVDSYNRCKVVSYPIIKDLVGDGSQAIVVRLRVHSNGAADVDVNHTSAYLYVPESKKFCKNEDAGNFASGVRVPNSVIKFGSSTCY